MVNLKFSTPIVGKKIKSIIRISKNSTDSLFFSPTNSEIIEYNRTNNIHAYLNESTPKLMVREYHNELGPTLNYKKLIYYNSFGTMDSVIRYDYDSIIFVKMEDEIDSSRVQKTDTPITKLLSVSGYYEPLHDYKRAVPIKEIEQKNIITIQNGQISKEVQTYMGRLWIFTNYYNGNQLVSKHWQVVLQDDSLSDTTISSCFLNYKGNQVVFISEFEINQKKDTLDKFHISFDYDALDRLIGYKKKWINSTKCQIGRITYLKNNDIVIEIQQNESDERSNRKIIYSLDKYHNIVRREEQFRGQNGEISRPCSNLFYSYDQYGNWTKMWGGTKYPTEDYGQTVERVITYY